MMNSTQKSKIYRKSIYQDTEETRSREGLVTSSWHLDGIREASCPLPCTT